MPKSRVKIEYAIVCDDVRREDNGKMIIIGVYASDIVLSSYPANIFLSLLLAIRSDLVQKVPATIRLMQDGENVYEAKGGIECTQPGGVAMLALGRIPVSFNKDSMLDFQIKIDSAKFKSVCKLPVRKMQT